MGNLLKIFTDTLAREGVSRKRLNVKISMLALVRQESDTEAMRKIGDALFSALAVYVPECLRSVRLKLKELKAPEAWLAHFENFVLRYAVLYFKRATHLGPE